MSTNILIAILVLVLLAIVGLYELVDRLGRRHKKGPACAVFELGEGKLNSNLFSQLKLPFAIEVAVKQFGKSSALYLIVPRAKALKISEELGVKEVPDYDLYSPGGVHIGAYLKGSGSVSDINTEKIDFSEVNEIGEGAVVQLIFNSKRKGKFDTNVRALISAPSQYQAKEIFSRIKNSLPAFKMVEVSNSEFMQRVNSRSFDAKELMELAA
jgi:hypothetical protein